MVAEFDAWLHIHTPGHTAKGLSGGAYQVKEEQVASVGTCGTDTIRTVVDVQRTTPRTRPAEAPTEAPV